MKPRVLILRAPGTNCDEETAEAWRRAGAEPALSHVDRLVERPEVLDGVPILTIPGGFSYGDDLGAGRILAFRVSAIEDRLRTFHERGGLILGICNGFQVLVHSGLLPGGPERPRATITANDSGHFECRWVRLAVQPNDSPFLTDTRLIEAPVAHGEGKFLVESEAALERLERAGQLVLRYANAEGRATQDYPANPNGSPRAVAGIVDPTGRILGLMPHPERNIHPLHHPQWTRRGPDAAPSGLAIFRNAVAACR